MKEAAGEANMTVITIVLIGVVAAVGLLLIPRLMKNSKFKACCTDAGWVVSGNLCCDPNVKDSNGKICQTAGSRFLATNATVDTSPLKECMK